MSYPIWRTKVFEVLDGYVEKHGDPVISMVAEWVEAKGRECMNYAECGNRVTRPETDVCPECRENYEGENVQY